MDGRAIKVEKEGVSQPDEIVRVLGEGMADKDRIGDLQVKLKVRLPQLSPEKA